MKIQISTYLNNLFAKKHLVGKKEHEKQLKIERRTWKREKGFLFEIKTPTKFCFKNRKINPHSFSSLFLLFFFSLNLFLHSFQINPSDLIIPTEKNLVPNL